MRSVRPSDDGRNVHASEMDYQEPVLFVLLSSEFFETCDEFCEIFPVAGPGLSRRSILAKADLSRRSPSTKEDGAGPGPSAPATTPSNRPVHNRPVKIDLLVAATGRVM
jgi:hypothetical protein